MRFPFLILLLMTAFLSFNCSSKKITDVSYLKSLEVSTTDNPKLNVFSVQVAGYDNSVTPENIYRGAILSGWTGKEVLFAQKIINFSTN